MKNLLLFLFAISFTFPLFAQDSEEMKALLADYEKLNDKADDLWPNLSKEALKKEHETLKSIHKKLKNLPFYALSSSDQITSDLLVLVLEDKLFHLEFESHLFPLNAEGGFLTSIIHSIRNTRVGTDKQYDKYTRKLKALPQYLALRKKQMQRGQKVGKSSPKLVVENCIKLLDDLLNTPVENTFFMLPLKVDDTREATILSIVKAELLPAYQNFRYFLKNDYLPKAPEKVGVAHITDGKSFYEQRIRYFTTTDLSPQEVFDLGMSEVARIRSEMEAIIEELGFEGSYADFLKFLREDPQFYPKTKDELLYKAAWITKEMEGKLPQYFGKMPRMPLTVKPVPESIAPNYTTGRYSPGSYKRHRAGEYWVNTHHLASRPFYVLPALSFHEGVPGHHLQIMLAQEIENVPKFRQETYLSAYGEGWGLYAEFLGKEMGMYKTHYEDFGRLTYEMWRACRLVVDPGMHYKDWSRERAFDFMASNTALSIHEVNTEINRYIGWPGQAVSYKIGELKIREIRKITAERLGDEFDIRAFHDKVLENGSIPLLTLERVVRDWVNELLRLNSPKKK